MLRNLEAEITRKKLSREEIASGIGISTRSLYDKLNGKSKFNVEEAFTLQRIFFPDKDIDYLFEQTDTRELSNTYRGDGQKENHY